MLYNTNMLKIIPKILKGDSEKKDFSEEVMPKRIQIAFCVLLLETAQIDDDFSGTEKAVVETILRREFNLSDPDAAELMEEALRKRTESVDLWEFTDILNRNYSDEQRMQILESAWKVIYADNKLNRYEDHLVHKLAKLLRLEHVDLIEAKLKVLEKIDHES